MRVLVYLFCLLALTTAGHAGVRHVIVVVMENKDAFEAGGQRGHYIYGNTNEAPYINGELLKQSARAGNFVDELPDDPSQPHYILMEAGTTKFKDTHFTCDNDPTKSCSDLFWWRNWTESREHLTAQIDAARDPTLTWMTYQEGIDSKTTGACPIHRAGLYVPKHNPFVYFADIAGSPPSAENAYCIAHTRDLSQFAADMQSGSLANYVFITPNLCFDMHGAPGCRTDKITNGDRFLRSFLPPLLSWARQNQGVVFVVWDESSPGKRVPFFAAGWGVKQDYESKLLYSHRSVLKTIERLLGLPVLDTVRSVADLADMFEPGVLE
jgi:hypothetical protein